jgi:hypothetical protein
MYFKSGLPVLSHKIGTGIHNKFVVKPDIWLYRLSFFYISRVAGKTDILPEHNTGIRNILSKNTGNAKKMYLYNIKQL